MISFYFIDVNDDNIIMKGFLQEVAHMAFLNHCLSSLGFMIQFILMGFLHCIDFPMPTHQMPIIYFMLIPLLLLSFPIFLFVSPHFP